MSVREKLLIINCACLNKTSSNPGLLKCVRQSLRVLKQATVDNLPVGVRRIDGLI